MHTDTFLINTKCHNTHLKLRLDIQDLHYLQKKPFINQNVTIRFHIDKNDFYSPLVRLKILFIPIIPP